LKIRKEGVRWVAKELKREMGG
jgi:hypothetical protein